MKRLPICILLLFCFVAAVLHPVKAAVRVEDDEVVFTVTAPGASSVFLVGDFNNWNATLEKMDRVGDDFEMRLFLLPGAYHYKFVIDGTWVSDPENPPADPQVGSRLVLEERADLLVMASDPVSAEAGPPGLQPAGRYIGEFAAQDGKTSDNQYLDFYFDYESSKMKASADFQSLGETWGISPLTARLDLFSGFIDLPLGGALLKGFENTPIWTSVDPFDLVGNVGVFDFNVGYLRQGASFELPLPLKIQLRTMYTDKTGPRQSPVVIPASAFENFENSMSPDTVVYRYDDSYQDSDSWAAELDADFGSVKFGYVNRHNRGLHPGLFANAVRDSAEFDLLVTNTREFWAANVLWLRWGVRDAFVLGLGYGAASADIRVGAQSTSAVDNIGDVPIGKETVRVEQDIPLQSSNRWQGSLDFEWRSIEGTLEYERSDFDFHFDKSSATRNAVLLDMRHVEKKWSLGATYRYVDQDYGNSPQAFHFQTPSRNFWLDYLDDLDISSLPAFDLPRFSTLELAYNLHKVPPFNGEPAPAHPPLSLEMIGQLTTSEVFKDFQYGALRASAEYRFAERLVAQGDIRVAVYDKPDWGLDETFVSSYFEFGYRVNRFQINLGVGFDSTVLDRIRNEFYDIGRIVFLREAIPNGLWRDEAQVLFDRLKAQEQALEDNDAITLEALIYF